MKITDLQSKIVTPKKEQTASVISSFASPTDAVTQIPFELLIPYENQPFKPYSNDKLNELAEDIKINGVLSPIIVRPVADGKYQILAGHNRTAASKLAGKTSIPAVIKTCDDDTAKLIVVNTNLNQRQELLHSEKAYAYKMQLEAMKHQGVTSDQLGPKLSVEVISEKTNDSQTQIKRYIRLTYLIKPLLDMIDNNKMPFMVGVNLSFLSENNQSILYNLITDNKIKITLSQSEELKRLNALGDFTLEMLDDFFNVPIKEKSNKKSYKITQVQKETILKCINGMKNSIDPKVYDELIALFET